MSTDPRIEAAAKALYAADKEFQPWETSPLRDFYLNAARVAIEGADNASIIATGEGLDALPVGSRVVMGDYYILREETPVDDGVWLDLGNGLRLDAEDLRIILKSYPARVIQWGQT